MSSIDRKPHVLRAEKTLTIPRHVIFYDTESNMQTADDGSVTHTLKLGQACYLRKAEHNRHEQQEWLAFTEQSVFWRFVLDHCAAKNKLWVIALNLAFDFTVVGGFQFLRAAGFKCSFFYSKAGTTLIKVKKKGSAIMFVDALNWFHESAEALGERVGVPKMEIDFETADDSYLKTYCKRDVEILIAAFKQLTAFLENKRVSRLCYTIGSTAMAAYLFRHYRKKIYIHNNAEAIDLERAAYKGGRTECFFIGSLNHGPYYVLDVNSLYPFVMRAFTYPVKYLHIVHDIDLLTLANFVRDYAVIARVILSTETAAYAVRQERTIFPIGRFEATLSTPELIMALAAGDIESVRSAVVYERANIFRSFVDHFYKLRREFADTGNKLFEHFTKILLNSLYGKFGQKGEQWTKIGDCPGEPDRIEDVIDAVTHRRRRLRYLFDEVFEMSGYTETRHSFPAISAHVTAYARLYLWRLLQVAGQRNCYYVDTDSLFVNRTGFDNLSAYMHDTDLGQLKTEKQTNSLTIHGLKDYVIGDTRKIKGVRKKAVRISDVEYEQEMWPSLLGVMRSDNVGQYTTETITKHLERNYDKGIIAADGWVVPYYLSDVVLPF